MTSKMTKFILPSVMATIAVLGLATILIEADAATCSGGKCYATI